MSLSCPNVALLWPSANRWEGVSPDRDPSACVDREITSQLNGIAAMGITMRICVRYLIAALIPTLTNSTGSNKEHLKVDDVPHGFYLWTSYCGAWLAYRLGGRFDPAEMPIVRSFLLSQISP